MVRGTVAEYARPHTRRNMCMCMKGYVGVLVAYMRMGVRERESRRERAWGLGVGEIVKE